MAENHVIRKTVLENCSQKLAIAFIAVAMFCQGCSSDRVPTYPVEGQVVFADGSPVRTGHVEFESIEHGTTASARVDQEGRFVLGTYTPTDGAAAGKHRVLVLQMIINDGTVDHIRDHGDPVAPKYNTFESSGLTATVEPKETNEITLTVEARQ